MKYTDYSVRDFVQDEYFQNWVFHNDEGINSYWENWLEGNPEKRGEIEQAKRLLKSLRLDKHTLTTSEVSSLWNRIQEDKDLGNIALYSSRKNWYAGIAAAVLVLAVTATYLLTSRSPWKKYHTRFGETLAISLPDSSTVVLNANSTLTLCAEWDQSNDREIWIDGEAFFDVKHKANDQPFRVSTLDGVSVEVLGTTFNVYNRTNETKVVLNTGHIKLNLPLVQAIETIMMNPGEMVEFKSQRYRKKDVNPELYTAWTSNKIILDHTSLRDMVQMLRDSYGLQVQVTDTLLLNQTVSGSMPLGNADNLLKQMSKAFQLRISKSADAIVIEDVIPP